MLILFTFKFAIIISYNSTMTGLLKKASESVLKFDRLLNFSIGMFYDFCKISTKWYSYVWKLDIF